MEHSIRDNAKGQRHGQLLCVLAMVLVGSTVPASKLIGETMDPFVATALRHAAALPVLLIGLLLQSTAWPRLCRHDRFVLLMQAAAGSVGYTVLLISGVQMASAADASVVTGTLPAVAALLSFAFLGERPKLRSLASIGLATAGVVLLTLVNPDAGTAAPSESRFLGMSLILGAVACEAVFILGQGRLRATLTPLQMSIAMSAGGLVLCALPAAVRWPVGGVLWQSTAIAGVLYYAWVGTVGGFVLWYAGAARTSAAGAALATAFLPLSAFALSAWWLAEPIHSLQWLSMGLVLIATALPLLLGKHRDVR
ncbi:DMT family transporter [Hydrogenophaga sp.]|uniref:DMT family transporter n=1 Tax=Hydrogenophaga sp. TaxID=1904254 RepID=UPI003F6EB829